MAKFTALLLLAVLGITAFAAASDEPPQIPSGELALTLFAKDSANFEILKNRQVTYAITNAAGKKIIFNEKTNENGSATIYLDPGQYALHAEIDDESTKGKDYAAAITIKVQKDETQRILFQPISSISLLAVNQENQVVPNARIEINCVKDLYPPTELNEKSEFTTDESGALFIKFLPTGNCQITGKYEEKTAVQTLETRAGEYKQISLALISQTASKTNNYAQMLAALAALAFLALIAALMFYSKKKFTPQPTQLTPTQPPQKQHANQHATKEPTRQQHEEKNTRLKDILKTLSPREKQIINVLTRSKGKVKQADIYRELLIPKATLSRTLDELEKKNIVKITPFGKINYVELSNWVLEQE